MTRKILRLTAGTQGMLRDLVATPDNPPPSKSAVIQAALLFAYKRKIKLDFLPGQVEVVDDNKAGDQICVSLTNDSLKKIKELSERWECSDNKAILTAIILLWYESYDNVVSVYEAYLAHTNQPKGGRPKSLEGDKVRVGFDLLKEEVEELRAIATLEGLSVGVYIRMVLKNYLRGIRE